MKARKPQVSIQMDGNAFAVMGAVSKALKRAGQGDKVDEYRAKAMSGDYDHLLQVSMQYVDFVGEPDEEEEPPEQDDYAEPPEEGEANGEA